MFEDVLDIEEIRTVDSVDEVNRLLQEDWQLIGFHAAPSVATGSSATSIFIMARISEEDYDEDLEDSDLELETYEPLPSSS